MNRTIVMYRIHPRIHPCTTHHVRTQQEAALHEPGTGSPSDTESASPWPWTSQSSKLWGVKPLADGALYREHEQIKTANTYRLDCRGTVDDPSLGTGGALSLSREAWDLQCGWVGLTQDTSPTLVKSTRPPLTHQGQPTFPDVSGTPHVPTLLPQWQPHTFSPLRGDWHTHYYFLHLFLFVQLWRWPTKVIWIIQGIMQGNKKYVQTEEDKNDFFMKHQL